MPTTARELLADAEAALAAAERPLARCRAGGRRPPFGGLGDVVVVASGLHPL